MTLQEQYEPNIARLAGTLPPGIEIANVIIQPISPEYRPGSPDEMGFMLKAMHRVDKALERAADEPDNNLVSRATILDTSTEARMSITQKAQNEILERIRDYIITDENARIIGLKQGVTPALATLFRNLAGYQNRIEPTRVSGYIGELAVEASVEQRLSPENAFASLIFILDDVWDTGHEIAAVLCEIEKLRGITSGDPDAGSLSFRLKQTRNKPFENNMELYDEVIERFHNANVVIAQLFYKNKPFHDRLVEYVNRHKDQDPWCKAQREIMLPSLVFGQYDWLKGDGLDTDIDSYTVMVDALRLLPEHIRKDRHVGGLFQALENSKLRVGSFVNGLIMLNRSDKNDLRLFVAKHLAEAMIDWANAGYRWQYMGYTTEEWTLS